MTPRRLLPYLLLFLALAGIYVGLKGREASRQAREREAGKIFQVKDGDISEVALKKGQEEIRLVKKDQEWRLATPVKAKADQQVVASLVATLAHLSKERDLGAPEDLKPFGLASPGLRVEFTAQGQPHRLSIGGAAPGDRSFYALKDQAPDLLLISAGDKISLDRSLTALRDKTLWAFRPDKVKSLRIKNGHTTVQLDNAGPQTWRWLGREGLKVRADRVESLLRLFHAARVQDFVAEAPKDLHPYGLAPKPLTEVAVAADQGQEVLTLGTRTDHGVYALKGGEGAVVLVDQGLSAQIAKTLAALEDRRLWPGPLTGVERLAWGPKERPWVAVPEKDFWRLTGPEGQEVQQPAGRLEAALWRLSRLEYDRLLPQATAPAPQGTYVLEVYGGDAKPRFRLEELARKGEQQVEVRTQTGEQTATALIPQKEYTAWQEEMTHLTAPPGKKE